MAEYTVDCDDNFKKMLDNLDHSVEIKVKKQIRKVINDPTCGKPMRNVRKGTREVRVKPFRLSYLFDESDGLIIFLDLYHKDKQ